MIPDYSYIMILFRYQIIRISRYC